ncbi:MAG: thioredoxin domain-containing protein, partial [Thermochromatium sp.]
STRFPRLARISLLSACLLLAAPVASAAELPSASPETVEQALNSSRPTILDLGARARIPCKRMAPILAGLAETYRERAQVLFIDLHEDEQAIKTWRIQMYPTQIFFDAQGAVLYGAALLFVLTNASEAGARHIDIRLSEDAARAWLILSDNGQGIPEAIRARLFEPFVMRSSASPHSSASVPASPRSPTATLAIWPAPAGSSCTSYSVTSMTAP